MWTASPAKMILPKNQCFNTPSSSEIICAFSLRFHNSPNTTVSVMGHSEILLTSASISASSYRLRVGQVHCWSSGSLLCTIIEIQSGWQRSRKENLSFEVTSISCAPSPGTGEDAITMALYWVTMATRAGCQ